MQYAARPALPLYVLMLAVAAAAILFGYLAPIDKQQAVASARDEIARAYPADRLDGYQLGALYNPSDLQEWMIDVEPPRLGMHHYVVWLDRRGRHPVVHRCLPDSPW